MTANRTTRAKSPIRYALASLLALIAFNALGGGYYGMTGAKGVPTEWLNGSPFPNYFIPSLILFAVIGTGALVSASAVFFYWRNARQMALIAGVIVLVWIAVQVAIIGYVSWMQPAVAIAALIILILAALWRV